MAFESHFKFLHSVLRALRFVSISGLSPNASGNENENDVSSEVWIAADTEVWIAVHVSDSRNMIRFISGALAFDNNFDFLHSVLRTLRFVYYIVVLYR